jgi:hypothetical protein
MSIHKCIRKGEKKPAGAGLDARNHYLMRFSIATGRYFGDFFSESIFG